MSPVKSLVELSLEVLERHRHAIGDLSGVPYRLIKRVLRLYSPKQLAEVELMNEWIKEDSDELWKHHLLTNFAEFRHKELIAPPSWRELYEEKQTEIQERQRRLSQKLRVLKKQVEEGKTSKKIQVLEKVPVKLRRGSSFSLGGEKKRCKFIEDAKKSMRQSLVHSTAKPMQAFSAKSSPSYSQLVRKMSTGDLSLSRPLSSSTSSANVSTDYLPSARTRSTIPSPPSIVSPSNTRHHQLKPVSTSRSFFKSLSGE